MKSIIAYTLIIVGILVMLYPKANEYYENKQTEALLQEIVNRDGNIENNFEFIDRKLLIEYQNAIQVLEEQRLIENGDSNGLVQEDNQEEIQKKKARELDTNLEAIAVIKIAKIKLSLPVLEGATKTNMRYAAAHLKETDFFGEHGNAAIAAHRAKTKGRLFNRLNEVEAGDEIIIETKGDTYVYVVDKISIVKPTDVSVLKRDNIDKALLTLITCDPLVNPTHRLIVRAKLKEA